jgi:plasmid stabilization system protein ParE
MHKVLITDFAKENLTQIYEYYKSVVSKTVADKIKLEIKKSLQSLKDEHLDWQDDDLLKPIGKNHKRLVCGNYLIIYYRNSELKTTFVTDIFDSRQDPNKKNP